MIVVSKYWMHICLRLVFRKIRIEGMYIRGKVRPEIGQAKTFEQLDLEQEIKLYRPDTTVYFKEIDFTKGYISRVFQRQSEDSYSIVVDCYK